MTPLCLRWVDFGSPEWEAAREVRNAELLRPIGLPDFSREVDDPQSEHLVALLASDVVGVVLLVPGEPPKLRQMAVSRLYQGKGVGRALVNELLRRVSNTGRREVICHARAEAVGFYRSLGFVVEGAPFTEVGIEHRFMRWLE